MAKLRQWIALCGCTVLAVVIFIFFFHHGNEFSYSVRKDIHVKSIARQTSIKAMDAASSVQFASLKDFIETRNNLSRLLNAKQQELGKLQCEVNECRSRSRLAPVAMQLTNFFCFSYNPV